MGQLTNLTFHISHQTKFSNFQTRIISFLTRGLTTNDIITRVLTNNLHKENPIFTMSECDNIISPYIRDFPIKTQVSYVKLTSSKSSN